eukprot:6175954-Pleurochrysis_carterae.AAC.3
MRVSTLLCLVATRKSYEDLLKSPSVLEQIQAAIYDFSMPAAHTCNCVDLDLLYTLPVKISATVNSATHELPFPCASTQPDSDEVDGWYYNSRAMLRRKTELALALGLQGVMIWEAGQDCRVNEVRRGGNVHVQTCPGGSSHSLLHAISEAVEAAADSRRGVPGDAKTREEL